MTTKLRGDGPIVMVDDSPTDIEIFQRCFERSLLVESYDLHPVRSGRELLDYMDSVESGTGSMPSIILLDINMPAMNGFETLQAVRSQPPFETIPTILFVSNSDNPDDIRRANQLGAAFAEKFESPNEGMEFFNQLMP